MTVPGNSHCGGMGGEIGAGGGAVVTGDGDWVEVDLLLEVPSAGDSDDDDIPVDCTAVVNEKEEGTDVDVEGVLLAPTRCFSAHFFHRLYLSTRKSQVKDIKYGLRVLTSA